MTPLARWRRFLLEAPQDRRFLPFLALFAAYLAIRGVAYSPLLVPAAALLLPPPTRRAAALAALALEAALIREHLWLLSNHGFLEVLVLALLAVFPTARQPVARAACVRALMAVFVVFTLWTGLQKLAHGYFPAGDYFLLEAALPGKLAERMAALFAPDERAALARYREDLLAFARTGAPGLFDPAPPRPWPLTLLSPAVCWLTLAAELSLPPLLIPRRTRTAAALALAVFIVGVELLADEWHFALLFGALLVPFAPPAPTSEATPDATLGRGPVLASAALLALLALWPAAQHAISRRTGLNPWKLGGFAMYAVPGWVETSREEVRLRGEAAWRPLRKGDPGVPRAEVERAEAVLKNAPFATSTAGDLLAELRRHRPEVEALRIRSRVIRHDRAAGRFRVVERVYEAP